MRKDSTQSHGGKKKHNETTEQARAASAISFVDLATANRQGDNDFSSDALVGDKLLHDDPTYAAIREQFPKIPISEVRNPVITFKIANFASMSPDQRRLIIDELHALKIRSTQVAVDVSKCAHMIDHVLAMGDMQASSGNEFRQKVKERMFN